MVGAYSYEEELSSFGNFVGASILGISNYDTIISHYTNDKHTIKDSFYDEYFKKINNNKNTLFFHSHTGKSNDKIFYESVNVIFESIKYNKKIDLAIIQWSGPNRRFQTVPSSNEDITKIVNINPHDFEKYGLKFEPFASNETIQYMLILQELYKKYNIEYVFVPYMELDSDSIKLSNIKSMIDESRLTCSLEIGHRNEIRKKGYSADFHGHPNIIGHYYIASKILDILEIGDSLVGFFDYCNKTFSDFSMHRVYYMNDYKLIKENADLLGDADKSILKKLFPKFI